MPDLPPSDEVREQELVDRAHGEWMAGTAERMTRLTEEAMALDPEDRAFLAGLLEAARINLMRSIEGEA